jgi:hypothetical protein
VLAETGNQPDEPAGDGRPATGFPVSGQDMAH